MATINPAMAHKPCDNGYELYLPILVNLLSLLWWMTIAYSVAFAVLVRNKFKPKFISSRGPTS